MKPHHKVQLQGNTLVKGRGVGSNRTGRFESWSRDDSDIDEWDEEFLPRLKTTVEFDSAKTAIAHNRSPDLPFDQSVNMYRGCEHGCPYCYARPSHTYLGYSAGLDFETRLMAKIEVAERLREEISRPSYKCKTIALGANTDPYQPIERKYRLTRKILEVLLEFRHPVQITTKSASIVRDLDLLSQLAALNLLEVNVSVTTLDAALSRAMEPRASAPNKRLKAITELAQNGIPVTIFVAPVIPGLNDHEIESIIEKCAQAGAHRAQWTMIRLPQEVNELFHEWLDSNFSTKAAKVMSLIRQVRDGRENTSEFFERMRGTGPFADLIDKRFAIAKRKFGLDSTPFKPDTSQFNHTPSAYVQADLFHSLC